MVLNTVHAVTSTITTHYTRIVFMKLVNCICEQRRTIKILKILLLLENVGPHKSKVTMTLLKKSWIWVLGSLLPSPLTVSCYNLPFPILKMWLTRHRFSRTKTLKKHVKSQLEGIPREWRHTLICVTTSIHSVYVFIGKSLYFDVV